MTSSGDTKRTDRPTDRPTLHTLSEEESLDAMGADRVFFIDIEKNQVGL